MTALPSEGESNISKPAKRIRWATQRVSSVRAARKRSSIIGRFQKHNAHNEKKRESGGTDSSNESRLGGIQEANEDEGSIDETTATRRRIFFNTPLPKDARDDEGRPLAHFNRNKIRTAKYTPLTFIPMNLWYQFHNIANLYFLFLIVLAFFSIFGASNPGLNAVPLLFILLVTAVKDALEDWQRTVLDNELNNSPVHRLVDWNNVNTSEDEVSTWRKIKKATSRGIASVFHQIKKRKTEKSGGGKTYAERALDETRSSIDTVQSREVEQISARPSIQSDSGHEESIQMTPIPSPLPPDSAKVNGELPATRSRSATSFSYENNQSEDLKETRQSTALAVKAYGSLINPFKEAPGNARFKKDYWKSVQVGDFIRIYNDDQIPADIAILSTSDPDGACYVETKSLDGETNLKVRHALHSGREIKHARDCERVEFMIESEPPHANLYQYSGVARWTQKNVAESHEPGVDMAEPININNLLLRGCSLRNTEWVLGVVVFTGDETKIMQNAGITLSKRSRISRDLNWNVIYNFIILFFMCLVTGIVQGVFSGESDTSTKYFEYGNIGGTPALDGFITFWTAVILFQNLVPISLYITLEIIKSAQAFFIYSDIHMYYERFDYPCTPKSWNISDDLGQIEYIFSDKTGTLTQNVMEFRKCTINGIPYGEAYTEAQAGLQKRQGIDVEAEGAKAHKQIAMDRAKMLEDLKKMHSNPYLHDEELTFVAPDFVQDLGGASGDEQKKANENFMLALALCHSVITEKTPGDPPRIEFKAQSPDEAALVSTARDCGFTVLGRSNDSIILNVLGEQREYSVLNTLEFNSSRKRMSAIIRMPDNRIMLFCKGADSIIYSRLRKGEQAQLRKETAEHLEMFAREGLRTLCIAQKEIGEDEYNNWNKDHDLAAAAVQDREDKLETVSDAIERDLTLLGGTAIEDQLQDGVPDTISLLGDAGIKLWVLTGDKVETAINIGFSCNLLDNEMDLIVFKLDDDSVDAASEQLDRHLRTFGMTGSDEEMIAARKDHGAPAATHAIVIDGDSLKVVLEDEIRQKFLLLCKQCKSVLCCRVSPSQKAAVVQMVKHGLDVMTLSVGDGANDVAMIQEADVGVGIAGEEGRQAVMSSDYAIGQFRFLKRLILVHGRWSYRRLGETIANFFYKNIVWTFALFWYQLYNSFDGSYLFDYTYILLYNTAFTSLPIIFMGILDQDVNDKVSLAVPQLYRRGIERLEWTQTKFWIYMLDGIYQSVICFFMPYLLFAPSVSATKDGLGIDDRERIGVYVGNAAVVVANVYILLNTYRWDWLMVLLVGISILLIWFWTGVYTAFTASSVFYEAAPQVYGQLSFWAATLLTMIICLTPRFTAKAFQKIFLPYDVDIIREQIRQGKYKYLDDVYPEAGASKLSPIASSDLSGGANNATQKQRRPTDDDRRPIYPPSVAQTSTTHNNRSQNGSDGTDYTGHRFSSDQQPRPFSNIMSAGDLPSRPLSTINPAGEPPSRPVSTALSFGEPPSRPLSIDRPRPSFDRMRTSMDKMRPSFEASRDLTSAAQLARVESSHSDAASSRPKIGSSNLR